MGTTVRELFNQSGINDFNKTKWGLNFYESNSGVYIVSMSEDPDCTIGMDYPKFDDERILFWINKLPNFKVDGINADLEIIKERLTKFWLRSENILYIGKAPTRNNGSGISTRVIEYYTTIIGSRGPHKGGQWIKTLADLNHFTVYYGNAENADAIEKDMLRYFNNSGLRDKSLELYSFSKYIPFANVRFEGDKKHGFKNHTL